MARLGLAGQGPARHGQARPGVAQRGLARQGNAGQGKAQPGLARRGEARQGKELIMTKEPAIIVNGTLLGEGQAMTVRVACNAFLIELTEADALSGDKHGRHMRNAYRERLREVLRLMTEGDKT
jgi:hypothetical protein